MEEGSMRVDANVSVRPAGSDELRTRCEIKNVNSIRSMGRAIGYEARRHIDLYENGDAPRQETRHWDEANGRTRPGRSKEDADDYRYFAEPDLLPLSPTEAEIVELDATMPALPHARRVRLGEAAGLAPADVAVVVERGQDDLAMAAIAAGGTGGAVIKHLVNNLSDGTGELSPEGFAALVSMEDRGELSSTQAKTVLAALVEASGDPASVAASLGFEAMETGELEALVEQLIDGHPDEWARFCEGDKKIQGFFVGQIMKATKGQADGKVVNQLLSQRSAS